MNPTCSNVSHTIGEPTKQSIAYAENLQTGRTWDIGNWRLTSDEIVSFASQWDPLPFQVDAALASETIFGELVASSIQSLAIFQRLCVDALFSRWPVQAGRGMRDLRFHQPVVADMRLIGRARIDQIEHRRGNMSLVHLSGELVTSDDSPASSLRMDIYVQTRATTSDRTPGPPSATDTGHWTRPGLIAAVTLRAIGSPSTQVAKIRITRPSVVQLRARPRP
ncbi:MaoC/PaaZ C-terminal domain-containing protein [Aeromicrobium sp.]|uniref:MaoC/PaaZ C-terminal domain-containing protein n=1 Tax=Aeromicrobium sp. TaxID=1871063 RepID=UPI0019C09893|nr:hypothetical protein [Aeromicrobium sp.]